jgi:DNA (cytosine-5)-methyltransferase 1
MLENVQGLMSSKFAADRAAILSKLERLGYVVRTDSWRTLLASDYGLSQARECAYLVALKPEFDPYFSWPLESPEDTITVGELLAPSMASQGWEGALEWSQRANTIGPTVVGGSKMHGGADLGPTRAKNAWKRLGVNPKSFADSVPDASGLQDSKPLDPEGPRLTVNQTRLLQGIPEDWKIMGRKTARYRQIASASPPPMATAVGLQIAEALDRALNGAPLFGSLT